MTDPILGFERNGDVTTVCLVTTSPRYYSRYNGFVFTPPFPLWFLILTSLLIGLVVGALIGLLASLLLRLKIRARFIIIDAILGALGFDTAWTIVLLIPWRNTITYGVDHIPVTSTMNHYQHPDLLAYIAAMLLPILHEVHRFRRSKATIN